MNLLICIVTTLIILKAIAEWTLDFINRRTVRAHANEVPPALQGVMDPDTYRRSVDYTLSKSRLNTWDIALDAALLLVLLPTGWLALLYGGIIEWTGMSLWVAPLVLILISFILGLPELPLQWWRQFRLEERFGFNKSTQLLWWTDRVKNLVIGLVLIYPLILAVVWFVNRFPDTWWIWGFVLTLTFTTLMTVVYPMLIMPLFNRFEPLADGPLRERLLQLADRAQFPAKTILVMDGSRRSGHSNAFFAGFGRFRRIVLFDTLIEQLNDDELEAVLAHEIGHYRLGHIPRMLVFGAVMTLAAFGVMAVALESAAFTASFGFPQASGQIIPVFLLVSMLSSVIVF